MGWPKGKLKKNFQKIFKTWQFFLRIQAQPFSAYMKEKKRSTNIRIEIYDFNIPKVLKPKFRFCPHKDFRKYLSWDTEIQNIVRNLTAFLCPKFKIISKVLFFTSKN